LRGHVLRTWAKHAHANSGVGMPPAVLETAPETEGIRLPVVRALRGASHSLAGWHGHAPLRGRAFCSAEMHGHAEARGRATQ
jgi:hypothetical protein